MFKLKTNDLQLAAEPLRLEIKELAEDIRYKYSKKGLSDIFDILSESAFLIRIPLETNEVSGFSTYFEGKFIVYLNSNFTLGHERFSGAHELYHITYDNEVLKKEKLLLIQTQSEDNRADVFAAEFLMPEDYVKEVFYKIVNVDSKDILPRHIVRMNNTLKVSYKAMLKRLIQLGLCHFEKYEVLLDICSLENAEKLQTLTRREGYDIDLIMPSKKIFVPYQYIEFIKGNYEKGSISYKNMKNCFEYLGLTAEQFGYEYPSGED